MLPFLTDGQRDLLAVLGLVLSAVSVVLGIIPFLRAARQERSSPHAGEMREGSAFIAWVADHLTLEVRPVRIAILSLWTAGAAAVLLAGLAAPPTGAAGSFAWQLVAFVAILLAVGHCSLLFWWIALRISHGLKIPDPGSWEIDVTFLAVVIRFALVLLVTSSAVFLWLAPLPDSLASRLGGLYALAGGITATGVLAAFLGEYRDFKRLGRTGAQGSSELYR